MKKIIFAAVAVISLLAVSSACKNPPIFAAIEQEVKLKPASIKGFVRGVLRIGDTFYTSNGKMFKKNVGETGQWSEMSGVPNGFCTGIATDTSNLYASFEKNNTFTSYKYNPTASSWEKLPAPATDAQRVMGTKTIFAVKQTQNGSYTLCPIENGTVRTQWNSTKHPVGAAGEYCLLEDGLYNKTGGKISGTPESGLKGICEGPSNSVFIFNDSTLSCYNGSSWTHFTHGIGNPQSTTYLSSKQLVLISGKAGYGEIKLANSTDLTGARSINAGSKESSVPSANLHQYINSVGKYTLNPINAFVHNSGYIIYAGANDPNTRYSGLWGFYVPGQIEWNRE